MGKIFIERLLRDTDVAKIYLLVRPKRGKTPQQRVREIFEDPVRNMQIILIKFPLMTSFVASSLTC